MKMKKYDLAKYSTGNLKRIRKVIKIVSDDLELQEINRLAGNKIPLKRFENQSLTYLEAIDVLKIIQRDFGLYRIANLEIERMVRKETPKYIFESNVPYASLEIHQRKEILKRLNITEDDVKNNIILRANTLDLVKKLKEILYSIDNSKRRAIGLPINWGWLSKKEGKYQFGKKEFTQGGDIRQKVFVESMDTYEETGVVSIKTVHAKTHLTPRRIRIELNHINKGLIKDTGYYFRGSRKGFYNFERFPSIKD